MYIHSLYHLCVLYFSADVVHFMNYCSLYGNRKKSRFPRRCGQITLISLVLSFFSSCASFGFINIRTRNQVWDAIRWACAVISFVCSLYLRIGHFTTMRKKIVNKMLVLYYKTDARNYEIMCNEYRGSRI